MATHSPFCRSNSTERCKRLSSLTVSMCQGLSCNRSATRLATAAGASFGWGRTELTSMAGNTPPRVCINGTGT